MSDVLARIRVCETHGIRRFLYPLSTAVTLYDNINTSSLCLVNQLDEPLPTQITCIEKRTYRIDFAISLAPMSKEEFRLQFGKAPEVPDPLFVKIEDDGLHSSQQRLDLTLSGTGTVAQVLYDGVSHLQQPVEIERTNHNGQYGEMQEVNTIYGGGPITSWVHAKGKYLDGSVAETQVEITACKSWVKLDHRIETPQPGDLISCGLDLHPNADVLFCDFGIGGYTYGKLEGGRTRGLELSVECNRDDTVGWSIATIRNNFRDRTDYVGRAVSRTQLLPQQWFHVSDSDKSIAVAITQVPSSCEYWRIALIPNGEIAISFSLRDEREVSDIPAQFGVCYHFLNDIPAVAAATNPQSILLPPTVEVLPA